jgi:hypothetical protein
MPQAGQSAGRPACAHRDYDSHAAITAVTTVRMAIAPWISIVSSPPAPALTRQSAGRPYRHPRHVRHGGNSPANNGE